MNPDQNEYPVDYLNQIAPQQKKAMLNPKLVFGLIGGGVLLLIVVVLLINSSGSAGPTQKMQTLAARLLTLQTISNDAQKTIKSGALRGINSNLNIFLTNTNRDIVSPLAKSGIEVAKIDKSITQKEDGSALKQRLENARLNAIYDRTYVREMNYQLDTVTTLMQDIYTSSGNASIKEFLVTTDKNLQPIKKQFLEFNAE
jgi:hypothetical protein